MAKRMCSFVKILVSVKQKPWISGNMCTLKVRLASSVSTPKVKEGRVSKNMLLKSLEYRSHGNKPLVLLYAWLFAKPAALVKYCDLYHRRGMDVLVMNARLKHFLWPPAGFKLADQVLDYLENEGTKHDTFLVHAFSIGAYLYTLMMIQAVDVEKFKPFRARVTGQIFDSVVIGNYDNMSTGIVSTFTGNKAVPTLVFYAQNDPMSDHEAMKNMIGVWKEKFPHMGVQTRSWEKSVHAAHLKFHEQEYLEAWENFMRKILP